VRTVIRQLRVSDLPRQVLPGGLSGYNLVWSREALAAAEHRLSLLQLANISLAPASSHHALVMLEGFHLRALAVVRPRRGMRSWELLHLYATPEALVRCGDLLERCGAYVAQQGGERLFLRLSHESPLMVVARRSGFFPGFAEEVYHLSERVDSQTAAHHLSLRPTSQADLYGLFRLYNACVPASVRSAYGLTLDQWLDSQESPPGRLAEFVWERDDVVRGWLRVVRRAGTFTMDAMLHPRENTLAALVCEEATRLVGADDHPQWVVPGHQPALASALRQKGWTVTHNYRVLVRPLAKGVREIAMSPARA
jgi:hypothetical protein